MSEAVVLSMEKFLRSKLELEDLKSRMHMGPVYYGFHAVHVPSSVMGQAQLNKIILKLRLGDVLDVEERKAVNKLLRKHKYNLMLSNLQLEVVKRLINKVEDLGLCGQPCP